MQVVPYLEGEYTLDMFQADMRAKVGARASKLCNARWQLMVASPTRWCGSRLL